MDTTTQENPATGEHKHSPEPWRVHEVLGSVYAQTDTLIADMALRTPVLANAARIVACVNACTDVPSLQLTPGSVRRAMIDADKFRDQVRDTHQRAVKAEQQRDQLLAQMHEIARCPYRDRKACVEIIGMAEQAIRAVGG